MKYTHKIFEGVIPEIDACNFLNSKHIPPTRIISLTPIEYHRYRYPGYGTESKVRKVVLFYIEE